MKPSNHRKTPVRPVATQYEPSKPIPIKRSRANDRDDEDEDPSEVAQYDWATWRMYARITNARRLRSMYLQDRNYRATYNKALVSNTAVNIDDQARPQVSPDGSDFAISPASHDNCDRHIMSMDDPPYGGVFVLD